MVSRISTARTDATRGEGRARLRPGVRRSLPPPSGPPCPNTLADPRAWPDPPRRDYTMALAGRQMRPPRASGSDIVADQRAAGRGAPGEAGQGLHLAGP